MYILVKLLISPVSPSHPACNWLITSKQDSTLLRNADTHGLVQRISSHALCSPVNHCGSALGYGHTPVLLCTPLRSERRASNICRAWMPQTTSHLASSSKHWLQWYTMVAHQRFGKSHPVEIILQYPPLSPSLVASYTVVAGHTGIPLIHFPLRLYRWQRSSLFITHNHLLLEQLVAKQRQFPLLLPSVTGLPCFLCIQSNFLVDAVMS
jgi:hypothetical protein